MHHPELVDLNRRQVLIAAAVAAPAIVLTSALPARASSLPVVDSLAFTASTYIAHACVPLSGAKVQASAAGLPVVGAQITVTVSGAGYAFPDGATTYSGVTDGAGQLSLPAFTTPTFVGNGTLGAVSGTTTATASISGFSNGTARQWYGYAINSGNSSAPGNVPLGSRAVGWLTFLAPNGDLYYNNAVLAHNVSSATAEHSEPGSGFMRDFLSFVSNGRAYVFYTGTAPQLFSSVPAGSRAIGWLTFLAPNGDLYYNNSLIAQAVTSATITHSEPGSGFKRDFFSYVSNGRAYTMHTGVSPTFVSAVPVGSTAIGWLTFLAPNGDLYFNGSVLGTQVTSAVVHHSEPGGGFQRTFVSFVSNGVARTWYTSHSGNTANAGVPANTTAVGFGLFVTATGDLYYNGAILATGVDSVNMQKSEPGDGFFRNFLSYTVSAGCA